ncbi:VWA domain-containing protein [Lentisphaera marina]|uniref:vWA domain-containing protein n=1 Tax=Lentisphaera marina TaxID=1111041 RepID=UPI002366D567|nr:VWA domain-containing protein [Lentisphaera marina]MDD7985639.1 VWA domain-containing protein [Lentisphaera marina]
MNLETIHFSSSIWFLLGILPLILMFQVFLSKGHSITLPMDGGKTKNQKYIKFFCDFAGLFPSLILLVVICLLAGPKIKGKPEDEKIISNIQICLDSSGSMRANFGGKNRYEVAMSAVKNFTEYRSGDAFGLTVFGSEYINWVPVTKDTSAIALATPFLAPDRMSKWFGGTNIAKALKGCQQQLMQQEEGDRMIILLSDGVSNSPSATVDMAQELRNNKIVVYCIYIGSGNGSPEMNALASITGGQVFGVNNPKALDETFRFIDKMEKAKFAKREAKEEDYYKPFSLAGLSLVSIYLLTLFGLRYNPW